MLELMDYLRANGFQVYIVSGGGVDFMRAFSEDVYGVAPSQVIGSSGKTRFVLQNGRATLIIRAEIGSVDDGEGKPINIHLHIGNRPILAFGNSDGDLQMLQYTDARQSPSMKLILHHDDDAREVAYDRASKIGRLDKALDAARKNNWMVVSMKNDWKTVFPEQP